LAIAGCRGHEISVVAIELGTKCRDDLAADLGVALGKRVSPVVERPLGDLESLLPKEDGGSARVPASERERYEPSLDFLAGVARTPPEVVKERLAKLGCHGPKVGRGAALPT
jgi:hypothetical protein